MVMVMVNTDKAIEYDKCCYKVERKLEQLKKIGINVKNFEDIYINIKNNVIAQKNNMYNNKYLDLSNTHVSLSDEMQLEQIYITYCSKLNSLYLDLEKYNIYMQLVSFTKLLKDFVENVNQETINGLASMRSKIMQMLKDMENSNTLDHEIEIPLFQDLYHYVYIFIKLEYRLLNDSPTLKMCETNENYVYNLDKEIVKNLEEIDLRDVKNAQIEKIVSSLDAMGSPTYLNADLIRAIVDVTYIEERINIINDLNNDLDKYIKKAQDLIHNTMFYKQNLENRKGHIRESRIDLFKRAGCFLASVAYFISLGFASFSLAKYLSKDKFYTKKTTYYDSITKKTSYTSEEVKVTGKIPEESIELIKYGPYKDALFGYYERRVDTYDVANLNVQNYDDYFNLDLEELGINGNKKYEDKKTLNIEDLYEEAYWQLKIVENDLSNYHEEPNFDAIFIDTLCLLALTVCLYFIIEYGLSKYLKNKDYLSLSNIPVLNNLMHIKKDLEDIRYFKIHNKPDIQELKIITKELQDIMHEYKPLITSFEKNLESIKDNAEYKDKLQKYEKTLRLVREISKN